MSGRKQTGTKLTTISFKVEEWEAEFINEMVANTGALLGLNKGKSLVYSLQVLKRYGDLASIVAGGILNMEGALQRIEANTELSVYGNDLEAIEVARQIQGGSASGGDDAPSSLDDLFDEFNIEVIGIDTADQNVEERTNLIEQDLSDLSAYRRLKRDFQTRSENRINASCNIQKHHAKHE